MSKEKGWVKIHRKIQDSDGYFDEPFCRNMAWIDMVLLANHDENSFRVRGIKVFVKRGQIGFTAEKLGVRWKWSRGKVLRFLTELQKNKQIVQQKSKITTLISILNYEKYQGYDTTDSTTGNTTNGTTERQQTVQQTDTNKNDKECIKNDKEIIRGEGDLQPLHTSPAGFHYLPDGRSYIEPTLFFKASDFNGLPQENKSAVKRFIETINSVQIEEQKITDLWEVFKIQELTFQKPYRNKEDVYRHFLNWAKKQSFKKGAAVKPSRTTNTTKTKKIIGVKWLNNFTQCEMSDGSIQELTVNQQDGAKHNQINPQSIIKS